MRLTYQEVKARAKRIVGYAPRNYDTSYKGAPRRIVWGRLSDETFKKLQDEFFPVINVAVRRTLSYTRIYIAEP